MKLKSVLQEFRIIPMSRWRLWFELVCHNCDVGKNELNLDVLERSLLSLGVTFCHNCKKVGSKISSKSCRFGLLWWPLCQPDSILSTSWTHHNGVAVDHDPFVSTRFDFAMLFQRDDFFRDLRVFFYECDKVWSSSLTKTLIAWLEVVSGSP